MQKTASAQWAGNLKEGKGSISTESGALQNQPFGFNTRFEDTPGTNPEELIGAAHAACFSMALSAELGKHDITLPSIKTTARVTLDKDGEGFSITRSDLEVSVEAGDADKEIVKEAIAITKKNCPVAKVLKATSEVTIKGL